MEYEEAETARRTANPNIRTSKRLQDKQAANKPKAEPECGKPRSFRLKGGMM